MNSWRPFANDVVSHTYEDFRKKFDKIYSSKPTQASPRREKFDMKSMFPYNLSTVDLEKRLEDFVELQKKVDKQRDDIKKRDQSYENKQKARIDLMKQDNENAKKMKKSMMNRIRSLGVRKTERSAERFQEEQVGSSTFYLTNVEAIEKKKTGKLFPSLNMSRNTFLSKL